MLFLKFLFDHKAVVPIFNILMTFFNVKASQGKMDTTSIEPYFAEPIPNVTVALGRSFSLPCIVENLGQYRIAWIHTRRYTLLTLQDRVITRSDRYRISHSGDRAWYLHINKVEEKDRGQYMCQINTSPMKSQVGHVEIVVPPQIDETLTSSDIDIREGVEAHLRCSANGYPKPGVIWRREDGMQFNVNEQIVHSYENPQLNFSHVSRQHMGAYLCIASNGIPPSVSKRIMLTVSFSPMIWIPHQLIGVLIGSDAILDCNLESFPKSVTFWTKGSGTLIISNMKFDSLLMPSGLYKTQMRLVIKNMQPEDLGSYTCVAKNPLGETEGTIRIYDIPPPSTTEVLKSQHLSKFQKSLDQSKRPLGEDSLKGSISSNLDLKKFTERTENKKGSIETGHSGCGKSKPVILHSKVFPIILIVLSSVHYT